MPLLLVGGVLLALIVRFVLATRIVTPWIMVDELIYSELAKSFADGGDFLLREFPGSLQRRVPGGDLARMVRRIGRDVLRARSSHQRSADGAGRSPRLSLGQAAHGSGVRPLAAVLVLLMPSLIYTGMLMTENAFFLAFVSTASRSPSALERPTLLHQAFVLVAIGLTCAVRFQALVLVPSTW